MIYAFQLYYLVCTLFLAGKDADSYQLKARENNALTAGRINRWHRDGVILAVLFVLPFIGKPTIFDLDPAPFWQCCVAALLIRLVFFDIPFNIWAPLPWQYIGGTAWADKLFVKIFGTAGAVKKSLTFLALLVGLNILNHFYL